MNKQTCEVDSEATESKVNVLGGLLLMVMELSMVFTDVTRRKERAAGGMWVKNASRDRTQTQ